MEQAACIHSVETCGTVDGPGLRYVVFFQGCNLRCKYCHNPDTWRINGGTILTMSDLIADVLKYKSYMKFSNGGFTACGGEPLLQSDFLAELFKQLKGHGIHTCLDTSGNLDVLRAEKLLSYTDLVLLDVKALNADKYRALTGGDIRVMQGFAQALNDLEIPVWVRYVVVPGLTDGDDDILSLAQYLNGLSNVRRVELLPFHKMGEEKWESLKLSYTLKDTPVPSAERMLRLNGLLNVHWRGSMLTALRD
ncbi:MAG: pyruvate formate-lyase-activating protein [Oscillospiraceae bacterium]|nr:pyruvate formate-lyase-activating protein [Oscillospiraceae bacterium]